MWWLGELFRTVIISAVGLFVFIIITGSGAPNL
jgi:hypothetical protein